MKRLLVLFTAGLVLGAVGVTVLLVVVTRHKLESLDVETDQVPVLVATRQVSPGEVPEPTAFTAVPLPSRFLTDDDVREADAHLVTRLPLSLPLEEGEPLSWSHFALVGRFTRAESCFEAVKKVADDEGAAAGQAALDALRGPTIEGGDADALPKPLPNAHGRVDVVVVGGALREGDILKRSDLVVASRPAELVTESWVPAASLEAVVGRRLNVPAEKGDGVWWQMLDDIAAPSTVDGCLANIELATSKASKKVAASAADAWTRATAKAGDP